MKILHVTPVVGNFSSGMSYSVIELVNNQAQISNSNVDLLIAKKNKSSIPKVTSHYYYLSDITDIDGFINMYDLVVFHSTFIPEYLKIYYFIKRNNRIKYIIVPRGGLTNGALNKKWIKKFLAKNLVFRNYFKKADAYHFLSENERNETKTGKIKSFVIPNGIASKEIKENDIRGSRDYLTFIFIGRLNIYHKGLDILMNTVKDNLEYLQKKNIIIELYGPSEDGSKEIIEEQISKFKLEDIVKINGAIFHEEKFKKLIESDYFIQTSRFEGLPMGVLEALSFGLPCLLTPGTNLADSVQNHEAGVKVEFNSESIINGFKRILESDYNQLSINAKSLADEYEWNHIAERTLIEYKKIVKK